MRFCNKLLSSIASQKHMSLYKHVAVMFYSTCSRGLHSKALKHYIFVIHVKWKNCKESQPL